MTTEQRPLMTEVEKIEAVDPNNSEYTIYRWASGTYNIRWFCKPQGVWFSQNRATLELARQAVAQWNDDAKISKQYAAAFQCAT